MAPLTQQLQTDFDASELDSFTFSRGKSLLDLEQLRVDGEGRDTVRFIGLQSAGFDLQRLPHLCEMVEAALSLGKRVEIHADSRYEGLVTLVLGRENAAKVKFVGYERGDHDLLSKFYAESSEEAAHDERGLNITLARMRLIARPGGTKWEEITEADQRFPGLKAISDYYPQTESGVPPLLSPILADPHAEQMKPMWREYAAQAGALRERLPFGEWKLAPIAYSGKLATDADTAFRNLVDLITVIGITQKLTNLLRATDEYADVLPVLHICQHGTSSGISEKVLHAVVNFYEEEGKAPPIIVPGGSSGEDNIWGAKFYRQALYLALLREVGGCNLSQPNTGMHLANAVGLSAIVPQEVTPDAPRVGSLSLQDRDFVLRELPADPRRVAEVIKLVRQPSIGSTSLRQQAEALKTGLTQKLFAHVQRVHQRLLLTNFWYDGADAPGEMRVF